MLIIESGDGWHRAAVEESDDGVAVVIFTRLAPIREVHRETIDAPFHVVIDRIVELLNQLQPPQNTQRRRDSVLSINGVAK